MTQAEIPVEILKDIRDAVRVTNDRVDLLRVELGARIDQTNLRLDHANLRLDGVEGAMLDLAEQQRFVVRYTKGLATRDERLEGEVADLRQRVESLEAKIERGQ